MSTWPTYDELPRDLSGAGTAWGLFGADDSIGRLNLITHDVVRDAVALVRRGASFGLDTAIGAFEPPLDSTRYRRDTGYCAGAPGRSRTSTTPSTTTFLRSLASGTHWRISPRDRACSTTVDRSRTSLTEDSTRSITGRAAAS